MNPTPITQLSDEQLWQEYRRLIPTPGEHSEAFPAVVQEIARRISQREVELLLALAEDLA